MRTFFVLHILTITIALSSEAIDVKHLSLSLQFDREKRIAIGTAAISLCTDSTTDKIFLDAGFLKINSVTMNGKDLKYNYDGGDADNDLEVILDKSYSSDKTITLSIAYQTTYENKADPNAIWGSFGKGLRFQQLTSTTPNKRKQIWSSGEPDGNKYWFPCNEELSDIHTTDIIATIEKPLMVIANGTLEETIEKENTRTFHYHSEKPFPNYLVSIVAGEYSDVKQNYNEIPIHNFCYPGEIDAVKATTVLLPDMMKFLEEKTGYKYPFGQYSQVVVQDYPFPGLNAQHTASILSDNYIDDHGVHEDFKYLWDGVAMQALAGQWFGNLIMPGSWNDIWLNNAFTQYFAGLYTEEQNSKAEYLTYYLPFEKGNIHGDWNNGNIHPIVTDKYNDVASFTNDSYSKFKGALILRMLQKETGDVNWWKAVQLYVRTNACKQVSTHDFQKAVETVTGTSYQWFFDQWVYKTGMPVFVVNKSYDPKLKKLQLSVKQIQKGDNKSQYEKVNFFSGKMLIEIDGRTESITLEPKEENIFTFDFLKEPVFVAFNSEDLWICETDYKCSGDDYLFQLLGSKDVVTKQRAMDKLVEIVNDTSASSSFKLKVIGAIKNEINSKEYWRHRMYALASLRKIISVPYDENITSLLMKLISSEKGWLKASAITTLGNTKDIKFIDVYTKALNDPSDRVINAAAIALGKTKDPKVLELLISLDKKPSWKNQSRISALNGLEQMGDTAATDYVLKCLSDNSSARWYLATPVWDYPFTAVNTLVSLGKSASGYSVLWERFKRSLQDNDLNDLFQNVQLINLLKDERAKEMYVVLKEKFKNDESTLAAVVNYETLFLESIKK